MSSLHRHSRNRRGLLRQIGLIARVEFGFFRRFPKLAWAALAIALIPSLYLVIYLSSVWDPAARAVALPVGLVNVDQGFSYRERQFNIGRDLMAQLRQKRQFGYREIGGEDEARRLVRQGKLAFALIVPADFSANAIPGMQPGKGQLVVYTSAGNNYESSMLAAQFAREVEDEVNDALSRQRWSLVLNASAGSQQSVDRLHEGVARLRTGATELAQGMDRATRAGNELQTGAGHLQDGVQRLADGTQQLGAGIRALEAGLPPVEEVRRLRLGAESLAAGHVELDKGLQELRSGSQRLVQGTAAFKAEAEGSLFVPSAVTEGVGRLQQGVNQLDHGLAQAHEGQQQLNQGAAQLSSNIRTLTGGVRELRLGLRTMVAKLPEDGQLNQLRSGAVEVEAASRQFHDGLRRLREGSQYLAAGIELMVQELPSSVESIEGSAEGLAHSVSPTLVVEAKVPNHGSGFAPNLVPAALWLGAGIAAFLVHVRVLPRIARRFSPTAQLLGKVLIPALVTLLQALLVFLTLRFVLGIGLQHPVAMLLTLVCASLTFVFIVFALTRAFGDAGKALAMLFLALQVSASGGVLPVELSGSLYAHLSPWLPMTWVVRGVKACMFDAFEGDWMLPLLLNALGGIVAAAIACWFGRWRFIHPRQARPAVEL